jgi:radical SAM superfamily enzyme YgiQ (UPF0313 family)
MKVLFYYHSEYLEIGIPGGIAILSAILKEHGHEVRLFETTFLRPSNYRKDMKAGPSIFKKTEHTIHDLVKDDPVVEIKEEFNRVLREYKPDLLAISAMTSSFDDTMEIVREVKPQCLVILGGVHATLCPEEALGEEIINMICIGEGEGAIVDLCDLMDRDRDITRIPNIWFKKNSGIIKNPLRDLIDMDDLPVPDWSIFDRRHLFRPFDGMIYRGSFITSSRGCPGACNYCVNGAIRKIYNGKGRYFRSQSPEKIARDIRELKENYGATWFKFADDTFLLRSVDELEGLRDLLKEMSIQFGCSVQPTTVTQRKVALAKEMGCVAMSVGIESGNETLRKRILNRNISNRELERAIRIIMEAGIRVSTFNMIGLPGETRENVFETIRFNKKLGIKAANVYILYPFPGTQIAESLRIDHRLGYKKTIPMSQASIFNLSSMSRDELEGLLKTFNLYLILPESEWGRIREAEGKGERSQKVFEELEELASSYL